GRQANPRQNYPGVHCAGAPNARRVLPHDPDSPGKITVSEAPAALSAAGASFLAIKLHHGESVSMRTFRRIRTVAQTFTTVPLLTYTVSYRLAGNPVRQHLARLDRRTRCGVMVPSWVVCGHPHP